MAYLDFEITVGLGVGDGFPVTAQAPKGGEALSMMHLPAAAIKRLDNHVAEAVRTSWLATGRPVGPQEDPVRALGTQLYYALFTARIRGLFISALHAATADGPLRIVLRVDAPELSALPWEFMFDPDDEGYLCLSLPVIRRLRVLHAEDPLRVEPPLRVLAMTGGPLGHSQLGVDDEITKLQAALAPLHEGGYIDVARVNGQSWRALSHALDESGPWHVLHFIGHGTFDSVAGEGALLLADDHGGVSALSATDLALLLKSHDSLRLVLLNACDTGRANTLAPFSSVAGALIRAGIPAVIAMQYAITDKAAITISQAFYQGIAAHFPVETALTRARQAVRLDYRGSLEWGTPVLHMRSADGQLFSFSRPPADLVPLNLPAAQSEAAAQENELDHLYSDAVDAYYTEHWDNAISLFQAIMARQREYRDVADKLDRAKKNQYMSTGYASALAAAGAKVWDKAVDAFEELFSADPDYKDVRTQLLSARRYRDVSILQAEARRLYDVRQWEAVVAIGEKLAAYGQEFADADGLVTEARDEISTRARSDQLAGDYSRAQSLIDAGDWRKALQTLDTILAKAPGYRNAGQLADAARRQLRSAHGFLDAPILLHTTAECHAKAVAFSSDGSLVSVLGSNLDIIKTIDGTAVLRVPYVGRLNAFLAATLNSDGSRLAAWQKEAIQIWDTVGRAIIITLNYPGTSSANAGSELAFDPTSRWIVSRHGNSIHFWDIERGRVTARCTGTGKPEFNPDGRKVVSPSEDGAQILDARNGQVLVSLNRGGIMASAVAFSGDGRYAATVGTDGYSQIWHSASGRQIQAINEGDPAYLVSLAPDGSWFATTLRSGPASTLRVRDTATGSTFLQVPYRQESWVALNPDCSMAASVLGGKVRIWRLRETVSG